MTTPPAPPSSRNTAQFALHGLYSLIATPLFCGVMFGVFCPLILVTPTLPLRRALGRFSVHVCLALIGQRVRHVGFDHLPDGPCVVVANHCSYIDGLILTARLPGRFTFVVQDGVARWPFVGWVLARMGVAYINRESARAGARQTRGLLKRLQDGTSLAIFAEGTFDDAMPGVLPFKSGAFLLAARAKVPVVPVAIAGSRQLLGGGWWGFRPSRTTLYGGVPVVPSGSDRPSVQRVSDLCRAFIVARCGEPDRARPVLARSPATD